jgi:hypothetical protein
MLARFTVFSGFRLSASEQGKRDILLFRLAGPARTRIGISKFKVSHINASCRYRIR